MIPARNIPSLNTLEKWLLAKSQEDKGRCKQDCPIKHYFSPGIYIREMFIPRDTLILGHAHLHSTMNIIIRGLARVRLEGEEELMLKKQGDTFTSPPGRKLVYTLEDTVWQNIIATEETDLDKIEDLFISKSLAWEASQVELVPCEVTNISSETGD